MPGQEKLEEGKRHLLSSYYVLSILHILVHLIITVHELTNITLLTHKAQRFVSCSAL